jgi:hypothetical protein
MRYLPLVLLSLLLVGCGPKSGDNYQDLIEEGDIYEDLIEGKRVEVATPSVPCGEMFDDLTTHYEARKIEIGLLPGDEIFAATESNLIPSKNFDDDQRDGKCFTYVEVYPLEFVTFTMVHFVSHEEIGKRWKKLN